MVYPPDLPTPHLSYSHMQPRRLLRGAARDNSKATGVAFDYFLFLWIYKWQWFLPHHLDLPHLSPRPIVLPFPASSSLHWNGSFSENPLILFCFINIPLWPLFQFEVGWEEVWAIQCKPLVFCWKVLQDETITCLSVFKIKCLDFSKCLFHNRTWRNIVNQQYFNNNKIIKKVDDGAQREQSRYFSPSPPVTKTTKVLINIHLLIFFPNSITSISFRQMWCPV